ncbi:FAD-dependent oxidoreductase [Fictibacillus sp. NPDC058756]|uniref:FAD-dependent oxidoreductase n=1 Tax=Fictibacillus sp. NPDC058756 TaxID=3346625 RepID=UPI0036A44C71
MSSTIHYQKTIPVAGQFDVIVAGGGWAGIIAACAAGRAGAKVLLVERSGFLGGNGTAALVGPFMSFHIKKQPLVSGIFQEVRDVVVAREGASGGSRGFDVEILKDVLNETILKYGVTPLYQTSVIDVIKKDERNITSLVVHNKSGLSTYTADYVIDATGDADLIHYGEGQYVVGRKEDGLTQAMTKMFKIANVNINEVLTFCRANKEHFMFIEEDVLVSIAGFKDIVADYKAKGLYPLPQDHVFFVTTNRRDEVLVNTTRVILKSGINGNDITDAEIESLSQAHAIMNLLKQEVPGFQDAYISTTAPQIGIRETRRIVGDYVLTREDVMYARKFPDAITHCMYPIDIHNPKGEGGELTNIPKGEYYDIPYRSLLPVDFDNVLVAGRCLSATHSAHSSARIQATCAGMGEAAGAAAALAKKYGVTTREVDIGELQQHLKERGQIIKPDYVQRMEVS